MTRRFGRNQKRRLRAELAAAEQQAERASAQSLQNAMSCHVALVRARDIESMLQDVGQVVGRYAMAAGIPTKFEAEWLKHGKQRFQLPVPIFAETLADYGMHHAETAAMVHDETMRLLEVEAICKEFSRDMHVRVTFDNIPIGYAISDHALRIVPEQVLMRNILREMEPLLIDAIRELKGKR